MLIWKFPQKPTDRQPTTHFSHHPRPRKTVDGNKINQFPIVALPKASGWAGGYGTESGVDRRRGCVCRNLAWKWKRKRKLFHRTHPLRPLVTRTESCVNVGIWARESINIGIVQMSRFRTPKTKLANWNRNNFERFFGRCISTRAHEYLCAARFNPIFGARPATWLLIELPPSVTSNYNCPRWEPAKLGIPIVRGESFAEATETWPG